MILLLILIAGFCLLLYPTVSDWWNSFHQSRAIASYVEAVENMSNDEMDEMLERAHEYNERLAETGIHFVLTDEEKEEYNSLLDMSGTGVMGYIQIPNINVNLPIYHGTDEAVLQVAVGHLEGTSLPIGGESTHAALSGHRGLPSAKLFTDQIRIVVPEDVSELTIQDGEDYCTLITCTPYGVNTHRMLVRGCRIENIREAAVIVSEAKKVPNYLVIPAVGVPLLFILLFLMMIYYSIFKPKKSRKQLMEEFRQGGWKQEK